MFSSQPAQGPAAQGGVRHAKKLLATEETGQGHCQAESSGSQGLKSRSQCPSVSANLAWPKSPSPGATALLKGVMWSHGQQLLHASFIQSSGCPLEAQGRGYSWQGALDSPLAPLELWLEEGQWKGQLLLSRRRSPWLRAGRGLQPSSWASLGSLAWATGSYRCPAVWRNPHGFRLFLNWFGKELLSKMALSASLCHSYMLYSLIRGAGEPHPGTPRPRQVGAGCITHSQAKGALGTCSETPWSFDSYWPRTQVLGAMPSWLPW